MMDSEHLGMERLSRNKYNQKISDLRNREYPMLRGRRCLIAFRHAYSYLYKSLGMTYLDHAGTTLYCRSLIDAFSRDMMSSLVGNPHSASSSSQLSSKRIDDVRLQILRLFNANPDQFDVVFTANATAGIKLVMESFKEHTNGFWYGYHNDSHTSLVGVREAAKVGHKCLTSHEVEIWLDGGKIADGAPADAQLGLFAYPAQSNMDGRRLPLNWPGRFRDLTAEPDYHVYTLLDAAAFVSTFPFDLSDALKAPDFISLSFYKMFGFPDLGALIVRKDSGPVLCHRKYFGGGTVEMVTCNHEQWHIKKEGSLHEQLEDGTLPVHSIIALENAISVHQRLYGTFTEISSHTTFLTGQLYEGLRSLKHANGSSLCKIYKDPASSYCDTDTQGPIIAFNLLNSQGAWISTAEVEKLAAIKDVHIRSGGLCNPGGIASSLDLRPWEMKKNYSSGQRCGNDKDIMDGKPTGMIRVSLGAMSILKDVANFLAFLQEFFVDNTPPPPRDISRISPLSGFYVETLMVYPIKSCGGWAIPHNVTWDVKAEGLAWDREWCLVHQGTRTALSQKRHPKMALFRPTIELDKGILRIRYNGAVAPSTPPEVTIPLSSDPTHFQNLIDTRSHAASRVCGDKVSMETYASSTITTFFTRNLGVPCYLARFPPQGSGASARHAKAHLQLPSDPQDIPGSCNTTFASPRHPILLSNESPILTISRSSLNRLNEKIKSKSPAGKAASAEIFRANIVIAEDPTSQPGTERPFIEETWRCMQVYAQAQRESPGGMSELPIRNVTLEILGVCRRCQMVCIDQSTSERNDEPFVTLAKTRRVDGKIVFGVHMAPMGECGRIKVGDKIKGIRDGQEEVEPG